MSAIAGIWTVTGEVEETPPLLTLLHSLSVFGPDRLDWIERGKYSCGRCLKRTLAEDRFDRQPLLCPNERFLLVADCRIDNREELASELGIDHVELSAASDSALLLRAWLAWGEATLERMNGDFALALFDRRDELLLLARDTAGERPLFYLNDRGRFAFASMPQALAGHFGLGINERRLAEFVSDLPNVGEDSFFAKVRRLAPGHILRVSRENVTIRPYWEPSRRELRLPDIAAYGEALKEQIDRAVARKSRRAGGMIATHLSSGFDSSAVTSSAAIQSALRAEDILSFTSAPVMGSEFAPDRRFADESAIAAATARLHPNIRHRIVRSENDPLQGLGETHRLAGQPVGSIFNNNWWQAINSQAAAEGAAILLTGEAGNFTLSAGRGLTPLGDLFRRGSWGSLWHESWSLRHDYSWLNLANAAFGGALPKSLYRTVRVLMGRDFRKSETFEFLKAEWRPHVSTRHRLDGWEWRPSLDSWGRRWQLLQTMDPGAFRKMALARWGIEERDPTSDRELVDFCFSLPPPALLREGVDRPALRRALSGRVAEEVLATRLRGYQSADWHRLVDPNRVRAFIDSRTSDGNVIDVTAVRNAVEEWPDTGWEDRSIIYRYAIDLMRTLAALDFAQVAANRKIARQ